MTKIWTLSTLYALFQDFGNPLPILNQPPPIPYKNSKLGDFIVFVTTCNNHHL